MLKHWKSGWSWLHVVVPVPGKHSDVMVCRQAHLQPELQARDAAAGDPPHSPEQEDQATGEKGVWQKNPIRCMLPTHAQHLTTLFTLDYLISVGCMLFDCWGLQCMQHGLHGKAHSLLVIPLPSLMV
jgi:hypothetical protein